MTDGRNFSSRPVPFRPGRNVFDHQCMGELVRFCSFWLQAVRAALLSSFCVPRHTMQLRLSLHPRGLNPFEAARAWHLRHVQKLPWLAIQERVWRARCVPDLCQAPHRMSREASRNSTICDNTTLLVCPICTRFVPGVTPIFARRFREFHDLWQVRPFGVPDLYPICARPHTDFREKLQGIQRFVTNPS